MAKVSWGKPIVEIAPSTSGAPGTVFTALPEIVENTALLTTTKGEKLEAKGEGGEVIDSKYKANSYMFECEVYVKKGDSKPIEDTDGVIVGDYTVRLTPEDDTQAGWIIAVARVSVEETWSSAIGKKWKYTFDALKPATGKMLDDYTKSALVVDPVSLSFTAAADTVGKTITATSTGDVTAASSDEDWATVTYAGKVVTVKVEANLNTDARTANVSITADNKTVNVVVTQEGA